MFFVPCVVGASECTLGSVPGRILYCVGFF